MTNPTTPDALRAIEEIDAKATTLWREDVGSGELHERYWHELRPALKGEDGEPVISQDVALPRADHDALLTLARDLARERDETRGETTRWLCEATLGKAAGHPQGPWYAANLYSLPDGSGCHNNPDIAQEFSWATKAEAEAWVAEKPTRAGFVAREHSWAPITEEMRLKAERDTALARLASVTAERDEAHRLILIVSKVIGGHMIGINCHSPSLTKEDGAAWSKVVTAARTALSPAGEGA